jgi:hypothetical protein
MRPVGTPLRSISALVNSVVVRRQHLGAPTPAAGVLVHHQIGEGAADVDAERVIAHERISSS